MNCRPSLVFEYDDYRACLRAFVERARDAGDEVSFASMAEAARVQRPYISNVLAGRATLNADQLYLIARALDLPHDATDYLLLLLEIDRCQIVGRRSELVQKAADLKRAWESTQKRVIGSEWQGDESSLAEYYADPWCGIVHVFLALESFRTDPKALQVRLGIDAEILQRALAVLTKLGLILADGEGRITLLKPSVHIKVGSYLSQLHATMFRLKAIERNQRRGVDDTFFSATFSADRATRDRLKQRWLDLLSELSSDVGAATPELVYQINFDLFEY